MSAWNYLKTAFWQRVPLPLLGRVPLNALALARFGITGFDNPLFWVLGAGWQTIWLTATAGRASYRRKVDATARRVLWHRVEERRLQLYNQLPPPEMLPISSYRPHMAYRPYLAYSLFNSPNPHSA